MNELNKPLIVEIFNAQGSLVKTEIVTSEQQEIDVTMLNNGFYLVRIVDLDFNNTQTTRLIINK